VWVLIYRNEIFNHVLAHTPAKYTRKHNIVHCEINTSSVERII